jgi:TatD DNase family protein
MDLYDTHCHLNHAAFDTDGADVRARASAAGVGHLLVIGYDRVSSRRAVALSREPGIVAAIGIHPESAREWDADAAAQMRDDYANQTARVAAYGEIGLDYHWESVPRDHQKVIFAEQIAFASGLSPDLPLIIHCRDAFDDVLAVLAEAATPAPVVMHCFGYDTAAARRCLDAGYYLGIGGVATFKKSEVVREAVRFAPIERILLETDSPYLAPQPWRGKRNEPAYVMAVAETVAAAKGLPVETVAEVTTATALRLFGGTSPQPSP